MSLSRVTLLLPLVFVLLACNDNGGAKTATEQQSKSQESAAKDKPATSRKFVAPIPNLNSPDNAVKSWWALNDAVQQFVNEGCKRNDWRNEAIVLARLSISAGGTKEFFQAPDDCILDTFDRKIERASVETDTRAVVMANIKNNTKLPEGVSLANSSKEDVEKGISYKYVLARESDKWYVDEVYYYSSTNVLLKRDPWQQEYKVEKNKNKYLSVSQQ